jgi:hypothetical protein
VVRDVAASPEAAEGAADVAAGRMEERQPGVGRNGQEAEQTQ